MWSVSIPSHPSLYAPACGLVLLFGALPINSSAISSGSFHESRLDTDLMHQTGSTDGAASNANPKSTLANKNVKKALEQALKSKLSYIDAMKAEANAIPGSWHIASAYIERALGLPRKSKPHFPFETSADQKRLRTKIESTLAASETTYNKLRGTVALHAESAIAEVAAEAREALQRLDQTKDTRPSPVPPKEETYDWVPPAGFSNSLEDAPRRSGPRNNADAITFSQFKGVFRGLLTGDSTISVRIKNRSKSPIASMRVQIGYSMFKQVMEDVSPVDLRERTISFKPKLAPGKSRTLKWTDSGATQFYTHFEVLQVNFGS
jgi:hypothetical protein